MTIPADRLRALLRAAHTQHRTLVMGILNVTPDSFSDGGRYNSLDDAVAQALRMVADGADIIDVGGESTRPGAPPAPEQQELARVIPVITEITRHTDVPISIDTYKACVARQAIQAGAAMINDISAFTLDKNMAATAASLAVPVCLMHTTGDPTVMQQRTDYGDVVADICVWLRQRAEAAIGAGVRPQDIVLDPGFGFGKTLDQNLTLLRRLRELTQLGYPLLVGTSRKSMIGKALGDLGPEDRMEGTAATVALAIANGATIVRVHDVKQMSRVARMTDAIVYS